MPSPKRILVVDDEPTIRIAFEFALEAEGFEVVTADNGKQAVDATAQLDFDLIIMDVRMKEMDGLEALKKMREADISTPVILATSHGNSEIVRTALTFRATGFLSKPVQPSDLRFATRRVLSRSDSVDQPAFEQAMWHLGSNDLPGAIARIKLESHPDPQLQALGEALTAIASNKKIDFHIGDIFSQLSYRV